MQLDRLPASVLTAMAGASLLAVQRGQAYVWHPARHHKPGRRWRKVQIPYAHCVKLKELQFIEVCYEPHRKLQLYRITEAGREWVVSHEAARRITNAIT